MNWVAISEGLPTGPVLVWADGEVYVAVLVGGHADPERAFMDIHSSDLLPWPTHWRKLPEPPAAISVARDWGAKGAAD